MPYTTPAQFDASEPTLKANRCVQHFGGAPRLKSTYVVARALGLLMFAPATTFALELGEASLKSGLGQSLVVEIPYRLAANERLTPQCISLVPPMRGAAALPAYTDASRVAVSSTHIRIFGDARVLEPLIGLNLDVRCSTVPRFVRSYELFVDPPARQPTMLVDEPRLAGARQQAAVDVAAPATSTSGAATSSAQSVNAATTVANASSPITRTVTAPREFASPRARGQAGGSLVQGTIYRVVRGDTLSGIAARIVDRSATIRETTDALFAANPEAFTRGNRDLIREGASISIPMLSPPPSSIAEPAPTPQLPITEAELPNVASAPALSLPPEPVSAAQPPLIDEAPSPVAPQAVQPAPVDVEPSAAPASEVPSSDVAVAELAATGRSPWLTTLLAIGALFILSTPLLFLRRRKQQASEQPEPRVRRSRPQRAVDPAAGIEVVESQPSQVPRRVDAGGAKVERKTSSAPAPADLAPTIGPIDSVDLDVGAPVVMDERVDWFGERDTATATNHSPAGDEIIDGVTATTKMPELDAPTVSQPSRQQNTAADITIDDARMTLTIAELDLLRQDWEAEHTMTQQTSQSLRDAIADLEATKAARDADQESPTVELAQPAPSEEADRAPRRTRAK